MGLFERNADKNIKALIVDHSYVDLSIVGPVLARYISLTTGEDYEFQPDAVMYSVHTIKNGDTESNEHIAMHYILIIKSGAKKEDGYIRSKNGDLSDIEKNGDGIILFHSEKALNKDYGEQTFTYPNDINGRSVDSETRKFPFYYLDECGELRQTYENLGFMYSIIDELVEKRIELEMTELDNSIYEALKRYVKCRKESK